MNVFIVNCFDTYENRARLLLSFFKAQGDNAVILSSDFRHIEKTRRTEAEVGFKFFTAEPYRTNLSLSRIMSHIHLSRDIFAYVREHAADVDLLWVLVPPNSFVHDAALIKRDFPQIKLVFDVIDMWPETMPVGLLKLGLWRELRDRYTGTADFIVTECHLYQKNLHASHMMTIYPARENLPLESTPSLPNNAVSLCYLGSVNHLIDIDGICDIVHMCKKSTPVIFHLIGDGEKKSELLKKAAQCGAEIIDHGIVYDHSEKQRIFNQCHFGLNVNKPDVFIGVTMKSIDYFEAGLPVINTIKGDTRALIKHYGAGINYRPETPLTYDSTMRTASRKVFDENFTTDIFYQKIKRIYEKVK